MKKFFVCLLAVLIVPATMALDMGNGFEINGGVKTGILVKNSDYTGRLGTLAHGGKYPMTLFFASADNESYKGEAWLGFGYNAETWGLSFSFWSHGDLRNYDNAVRLGDFYLWANLLEDRFRFIGGQGGGTPISTGGWVNADWLGYTGLRLFWVDPLGFSVGINFPDPDNGSKAEGIRPVNYLSTIRFGAGFKFNNFFASLIFDNNPIYDDSDANFDGGLHRHPATEPIAQSGNIGFGIGIENLFAGKGLLVFDGMVTNLGEDDKPSAGTYGISPVNTILALKAGYPVNDLLYTELKAKYIIRQGDNADNTAAAAWGKFEIEPYAGYQIINNLRFEMSFNFTRYINSYYLAIDHGATSNNPRQDAGQVAPYRDNGDFYSSWQIAFRPALSYSFGGATVMLGYSGDFSRDRAANTMFLDFRWMF